MPVTSIDEVILKLEAIIEASVKNNSRLGYFASLYKRMTIAVKNKIKNGAFDDGPRMEKLDVIFAMRYLDAYEAYQTGKPLSQSWRKAFDAASEDYVTVFQHLVLGISAHINLDLGAAAAETIKGQSIMLIENDFNKINIVIGDLVNEVQSELSEISFPMRFYRDLMNNKGEAVINFSIGIARKQAWLLAESLALLNDNGKIDLMNKTDGVIAELQTQIINPGFRSQILLKLTKFFEIDDEKRIIEILNRNM